MEGTIVTISTRCPSLEELESCQNIYLSEAESWDPPNVNFKIILMEEESRHSIDSRSIFDITMSSISSELCEDTLTARLVPAVNVHVIKPEHKPTIPDTPLPTPNIAAITHERHHKLTPKSLAQKWNIGLNTAKKAIKVTTQLGVKSALGPQTWRYCTDTTQTHLRRLDTTFYTDTLFDKWKSITGNNVSQVKTDCQGFVHVNPRTSKSLAGITLNNLTVGITCSTLLRIIDLHLANKVSM